MKCDRCGEVNPAEIHTCTPQEPVAWVVYENGEKHGIDFDEDEIAELPVGTMLYTSPPQREWQGLTDAEAENIIDDCWDDPDMFIEAIEHVLRRKNS
jgi:hypothetical protein